MLALQGADGVLTTIQVGGREAALNDVAIPKEYGISINIGDTRGPAGIFRFLRTLPDMIEIAKDIEKICPDAVWLNYTNPMAMLCRAFRGKFYNLSEFSMGPFDVLVTGIMFLAIAGIGALEWVR